MNESILKNGVFDKVLVATVAGTSDTLIGDILDLAGYDSVCFVAILGDVTATCVATLKAMCGAAANLAGGAYKTATAAVTADATSADNKLLVLDVVQPGTRYVRGDLVRATANAVVDGIIAYRYNARTVPTTQPADVVNSAISIN